jgi:hypothetical protein
MDKSRGYIGWRIVSEIWNKDNIPRKKGEGTKIVGEKEMTKEVKQISKEQEVILVPLTREMIEHMIKDYEQYKTVIYPLTTMFTINYLWKCLEGKVGE